jgi:ADP-heptose:LPS heptosyltransferase
LDYLAPARLLGYFSSAHSALRERFPLRRSAQLTMKRHLVIQLARFGDLLQSKRLLCSAASEPGDEVHLCLDRSLADLARRIFPHVHVHPIRSHGAVPEALGEVFRENCQVFGELQALHFDTIYNLNFSGLNFALAALFEPERVRGYSWSNGQPLKSPWTDMAFRWTRHRRISPLNLMDFWAFFAPSPMPGQEVNPPATPKGGGVGVAVAGRHSRRSLPPEAMAACVQAAAERLGGARIKLLGTQTEKPQAKAVQNALAPRYQGLVDDLTGKTDWNTLIETVGGAGCASHPGYRGHASGRAPWDPGGSLFPLLCLGLGDRPLWGGS